ncbi:hypothetical protein BH10ACT11_BH10ACT11_11970 [soil metagenome]
MAALHLDSRRMVMIGSKGESDASQPDASRPVMSGGQLLELIDRALADLDRDQRMGPVLSASGMRVRLEVTDLGLTLDVAAVEGSADHHIRWGFTDAGWEPKLSLRMGSATANLYLQGQESLAIAIDRGRVRCRGESRVAILYLPLLRLIVEPYTRAVRESAPALAV